MQVRSPEYRGCDQWKFAIAASVKAAIVLSTIGLGTGVGMSSSAAQEAATDAAYVAEVRGRVVAFAHGAPVLVSAFDVIADRTRVDLLADSELQVCHQRTGRFLTLKGPSRVMISVNGVSNEAGKSVEPAEPCAAPVVSKLSGGLLTRGVLSKQ